MVLHTGDFKMDQLPLDGRLTDLGGFARLGDEGVDLLMSDSTNAEVPGIVTSERDIAPVLAEIFASAEQRIIVACFASHVHRVQQILDTAATHRRKVAFVGPVHGAQHGRRPRPRLPAHPEVPGGLMVDLKEAEEMPADRIVLISTGSQGEPMSALSRMAGRDHQIRVAEGDTVILASSLIPGNETAVYRVINALTRWGARVVHRGNALVHVSGHAPAGELLYVLNLARPRNFMPVHGEWRHLRAHARLASLTGVPDDNIVIAENGMVVDLIDGQASVSGVVPVGYVYVDGLSVGEVTETSLKDRRILGDEGFVSIVVVVDSTTGKLAARPEIHARGSGIDDAAFSAVRPRIEEVLAARRGRGDQRLPAAQPAGPADRGPVGERELPPPPHDHPGRGGRLARPRSRPGRLPGHVKPCARSAGVSFAPDRGVLVTVGSMATRVPKSGPPRSGTRPQGRTVSRTPPAGQRVRRPDQHQAAGQRERQTGQGARRSGGRQGRARQGTSRRPTRS